MIVGFTGTQHGLTSKQHAELEFWLTRLRLLVDSAGVFHHGCCIGADAEAHALARSAEFDIVGHPGYPVGHVKRAGFGLGQFVGLHAVRDPLIRNVDIVEACDVLIVCPRERKMVQRSGTWTTYRRAADVGKTTIMIYP